MQLKCRMQYIQGYLSDIRKKKTAEDWCPPGKTPPPEGVDLALDRDFEKHRKIAEANLEKMRNETIKALPPYKKLTTPDLQKLTKNSLPGEMYGLPVPPTLSDFEKLGEKYMTQCFHVAGTIPKDNAVKKILAFKRLPMTGQMAAGGSGPKAFITVEYDKEDPDLHTQLFMKMPWAMEGESKEMGVDPFYRWKCSATCDYEAQEATIYRFLGPIFPFKIPKYYFADICRENTNYILITEKIQYADRGKTEFAKYEIIPTGEKYWDWKFEPRVQYEMYYAFMRCQARMAAWDKLGRYNHCPPDLRGLGMAPPMIGSFEWPPQADPKARKVQVNRGLKCAETFKEFMTSAKFGKKLFPKELTDTDFIKAIYSCICDSFPYGSEIFLYSCLFPDMIAFQHWNLQSDNGYFWWTDDDKLDCGLIDWGGAAPASFPAKLSGSITAMLGDVLHVHEDGLIKCFIDEYYRECGIKLNFFEFRRQWWLAYCGYIGSLGTNIEFEIFREHPREEWDKVEDIWSDMVAGTWTVRCQVFMTLEAMKYLHARWLAKRKGNLHCHDTFLEWKDYWEARGMN